MRKINQSKRPDNEKILTDFANGKTGKIIFRNAIRCDLSKLTSAYKRYASEFSAPSSISDSAMQVESSAKILVKKYESASNNQSLQFIGDRRKHHNFLCCPFCGGLGQFTLDHYLPKENGYGHYSVLSDNLVPCCSFCQGIKRTKTPTNNTQRIIHPYFDDINDLVALFIRPIIDPFDILTSTFEFITTINKTGDDHNGHCKTYAKNLQDSHIRLMELETRIDMKRNLETAWRGILSRASAAWLEKGTDAKTHLLKEIDHLGQEYTSADDLALLPISYKIALHIGILTEPTCLQKIDDNSLLQSSLPKPPSLLRKILDY